MGTVEKTKTKMQKTIKMCLAAAVLSVSSAVSIPTDGIPNDDQPMRETKCQRKAKMAVKSYRKQCKAIDIGLTEDQLTECFARCEMLDVEEGRRICEQE